MKKVIPFLMMGAALSAAACTSEGPGEIGTKADIIVRNAGDPPAPSKADPSNAATAAPVDPVVAAHQKAVEEAASVIEDQALSDPDSTPVPGEPLTPSTATDTTDAVTASTLNIPEDGKPMDSTPMVEIKPMGSTPMKDPATATEEAPLQSQERLAGAEATAPAPAPAAIQQTQTQAPAPAPLSEPVQAAVAPPSPAAVAASSSIYPTEDYKAPQSPSSVKTGRVPAPDSALITAAQNALAAKGYYFGSADGRIGAEFLNALYLYQNAHKMTQTGLTYEALEKLGVSTAGY